MLSEHFIASTGTAAKTVSTSIAKDAGVFLHEFQPLLQQRAVFKKSATPTNGLAISESHVYAAQIDKGVVHVYNREKGNQEAIVPFTDKISAIALACNDTVLILGTIDGRIFLWETATGRQVSTTQAHLQAVTALAVDATSNTLLSASKDSTVHVWSIPALLSFGSTSGTAPLRTFTAHNTEISSLVLTQGSPVSAFAVSVSKDRTCLVWDYKTANVLRTYLLPSVPLCAALDPAARAIYIGSEDGSVQQLDLFTSLDAVQNARNPTEPLQPPASTRWQPPDTFAGPAVSISVSYDGNMVLTGHQSGSILSWDVGRRTWSTNLAQIPLPGPVNNLIFLPVSGHDENNARSPDNFRVNEVIKPKFGAFDTSDGGVVPGNYTVSAQLTSVLGRSAAHTQSKFQLALTAPVFSDDMMDEGLRELAEWTKSSGSAVETADTDDDFMALDNENAPTGNPTLQEENAMLRARVEALQKVHQKSFQRIEKLSEEKRTLIKREQRRLGHQNEKFAGEGSDSSD